MTFSSIQLGADACNPPTACDHDEVVWQLTSRDGPLWTWVNNVSAKLLTGGLANEERNRE
jgi:hypothetical protein